MKIRNRSHLDDVKERGELRKNNGLVATRLSELVEAASSTGFAEGKVPVAMPSPVTEKKGYAFSPQDTFKYRSDDRKHVLRDYHPYGLKDSGGTASERNGPRIS